MNRALFRLLAFLFLAAIVLPSLVHGQQVNSGKITPPVNSAFNKEQGIAWLTDSVLKLGNDDRMVVESSTTTGPGEERITLRQRYKGLPVENTRYFLHLKNGMVRLANGEFHPGINIDVNSAITLTEAQSLAIAHFTSGDPEQLPEVTKSERLVVYPWSASYFLCYAIELRSSYPLRRTITYVDAHTGEIVNEVSVACDGNAQGVAETHYHGTQQIITDSIGPGLFRLYDASRGQGIHTLNLKKATLIYGAEEFTDADNYWDDTLNYNDAALDVHYSMQQTFDFYQQKFGKTGIDTIGSVINAFAHYGPNTANAFWDGEALYFGDGNGVSAFPFTTMDIIAHEYTHGITQYTANLIYQLAPGALNESFSDIFGVTLDFWTDSANANWDVGEQVMASGMPIRSFSNPNACGQPDTYAGYLWCNCHPTNDNGGVHTNSGVQNYWYYLLVNGGSGVNDKGDVYQVTGIGIEKAIQIVYRSLSVYLTENSVYNDAREFSILAAEDLYGVCSPEVREVTNAWYAVNVGDPFDPNYPIAEFQANYNPCIVPSTINFMNTSSHVSSVWWEFGNGDTSTAYSPQYTYADSGSYTVTLIGWSGAACLADTFIMKHFIKLQGQFPAANCYAYTINSPDQNYLLQLGRYNNSYTSALTCSNNNIAMLEAGGFDSLVINDPGFIYARVWIDADNNGAFDSTETIYNSPNPIKQHRIVIYHPLNPILNTPLLARGAIDTIPINGSCDSLQVGTARDFIVYYISPDSLPPQAEFTSDKTITEPGLPVTLYDLSEYSPDNWQWIVPGAVPSSGSQHTLTLQFPDTGIYDVTLIVSNAFGVDTLFRPGYFKVLHYDNLCLFTGVVTSTGHGFYDSGGLMGNYQDNEDCQVIVNVPCADSYIINRGPYSMQTQKDYLRFYSGGDTLISYYSFTGNSPSTSDYLIPNDTILIRFLSDSAITDAGFLFEILPVMRPTTVPLVSILVSDINPALGDSVLFSNMDSVNITGYFWDFDDGITSSVSKPVHVWQTPGTYTVSLTISNCYSAFTDSVTIVVQDSPHAAVNPDSISVSLGCVDSMVVPITIFNTGFGNMNYSIFPDSKNNLDVLVYGGYTYPLGPFNGAIQKMENLFNYTFTHTTDSLEFASMLPAYDVLLVAPIADSFSTEMALFSSAMNDFIASGKTVVFVMEGGNSLPINASGLFNTLPTYTYPPMLVNTESPYTKGLPDTIMDGNVNRFVLNPDAEFLIANDSLVSYAVRNIGSGRAFMISPYIGFGYIFPVYEQVIKNALLSATVLPETDWISVSDTAGTLLPGDSIVVDIFINSTGHPTGTFYGSVEVVYNGNPDSVFSIPIDLTVSGGPVCTLDQPCVDFGAIRQFEQPDTRIFVHNTGCDTLIIDSIYSSAGYIVLSENSLTIAPKDSARLIVGINPLTTGIYADTVYLDGNAGLTALCVNANVSASPVVSHTAGLISITLGSCPDSVTIPVTFYNSGAAPLEYRTYNQFVDDTMKIFGLITSYTNGFSYNYYRYTMLLPLKEKYKNIQLTTSWGNAGGYLLVDSLIKSVDMAISSQTGINSPYTDTIFKRFIREGGTLFYTDRIYDFPENLFVKRFMDGYQKWYSSGYGFIEVSDTMELLARNYNTGFLGNGYFATPVLFNKEVKKVFTYQDYGLIFYHYLSAGRFLSGNFIGSYPVNNPLFMNAMEWGASMPVVSQTVPNSGVVLPGDSTTLQFTLRNRGFKGGTYERFLLVATNDPVRPWDSIPVTLTISGAPCTEFTDTLSACGDTSRFYDYSLNNPTSWLWDFGNGQTSPLQNPGVLYTGTGSYNVSLTACNSEGCNTSSRMIHIMTLAAPQYSCNATSNSNTQSKIIRVKLNTIDNYTGYLGFSPNYLMQYSCVWSTELYTDSTYLLEMYGGFEREIGSLGHYYAYQGWIDFNADSILTTNEIVFSDSGITEGYYATTIAIPDTGIVVDTTLLLRVMCMEDPLNATSCYAFQARYEDYGVIIRRDSTVSIAEIANADGEIIQVVPNPSRDIFHFITSQKNSLKEIWITDISGRLIQITKYNTVDLRSHPPGIYFYKYFTNDGTSFSGKLVLH